MAIIEKLTDSSSINRARMERVLALAAEILGYNPDYISTVPGQLPNDYADDGTPYGWYIRIINNDQYIQPLVWDVDHWEHLGPALTTQQALSATAGRIDTKYIKSNRLDSPLNEADVTTKPQIQNVIQLTQAEYDAIVTANRLMSTTLYIIVE